MMRRIGCLGVLMTLAASPALGAGWTTVDRSIVAMGAGGVGAAHAADPGVAGYNPAAALARPGLTATFGLTIANPQISASGDGIDASTTGISTPPMASVQWANDRFGVGAGLTVPFGSRITWPADWSGRFELEQAKLQVLRTTLYGGARIGPVYVAAGGFIDAASLSFKRNLDFIAMEGQASIETNATGFGGVLGVYGTIGEDWALGLSYQSRSKASFAGWADFSTPPELARSATDQPVTSDVTLPDRFILGAQWEATEDLRLLADLELTLWNTVDALRVDFEDPDMADLDQPRRWRPTVTPRIGAAYQPWSFLQARAGFFVDPTPVPGDTAGPSAPDSTRVGISLGAGLSPLSWLTVDLAYQAVIFTGQTSEAEPLDGVRYSGVAHLFGVGLAVHAL